MQENPTFNSTRATDEGFCNSTMKNNGSTPHRHVKSVLQTENQSMNKTRQDFPGQKVLVNIAYKNKQHLQRDQVSQIIQDHRDKPKYLIIAASKDTIN